MKFQLSRFRLARTLYSSSQDDLQHVFLVGRRDILGVASDVLVFGYSDLVVTVACDWRSQPF